MKEDLPRKLGGRIKDLRKKKLFTQEILGERAMVSYKFVGEIERGEANPTVDVLSRIAEALEVPLMDLFIFPEGSEKKESLSYREPREHGHYVQEALKGLLPTKDIKKQRQVLKAIKLLRSAFKN